MNIFLLDNDPVQAAKYHFDRHVVKMTVETAQLLSNCIEYQEGKTYRHSHEKHPCTLWVKESPVHFWWLFYFGLALGEEYTFRYGKKHSSIAVIEECGKHMIHSCGTPSHFVQVMPDECKVPGNTVQAYRNLYMGPKRALAKWKKRDTPWWWV